MESRSPSVADASDHTCRQFRPLFSMKLRYLTLLFATSCAVATAAPVKLVFDTDMGNDVDDLMALCMIHNLQKRGACELLAVTVTKDHPQAAAFVDAVNTFYGRPDVPIGVVRHGAAPEPGKFNLLADARNDDGSLRYPHDLKSGADAPEAVGLIRRLLAAQPDASVALVQVGFFTNFARLLDSKPDEHSPLAGRDLIAKKVKLLSIMAGAFQTVNWNTRHLEYNVVKDVPAAQALAKRWPAPVVWSGYEIGVAAAFPHGVIESDLDYVAHHPLKEAYYLYSPPPHDRPTWDPTALLYAVYPDRGYFDLSPAGTVTVEDNGATWFRPAKDGKGPHRFLVMSPAQTARVREAIVQLSVEPPAGPGASISRP
jgi:inosine-uridine nucleoside N-ribohydrolase